MLNWIAPTAEVIHAADLIAEVDAVLDRLRNHRIGAAPQRLLPRRIAARAKVLNISDQTAFVDRLLMDKMESEVAAIRRAAKGCRRRVSGLHERCALRPAGLRTDR